VDLVSSPTSRYLPAFTTLVPLASASRAGAVAQRLSDAIKLGLIAHGEQLPSEAELATHLGVATVTLREALAALRDQGLIETRRGRGGGSFVCQPRTTSLRSVRDRLRALSSDELRDVADYRSAVSGAAAELAAERASRFEVNRLVTQASKAAEAATIDARRRADSRFHIELAAAGHSTRLTRSEIGIQAELADLLLLLFEDDADLDRALRDHEAIMSAIANRDGERASRLARDHVAAESARLIDIHLSLVNGAPW
jgi:GntR family transcriptional regulator, transcriptional repressor for pyruvate dehydrogenase complex